MTDGVALSVFQPTFRVDNRSDSNRLTTSNFPLNDGANQRRADASVSVGLSSRALAEISNPTDQRGLDRFISAINNTTPRTRDAAINLIGPFFRAAQSGRALTGEEAGQVGEAFFTLNANAGFGNTPQSLSTRERTSLIENLTEFDSITRRTGNSTLSQADRSALDRTITAVSQQLDAPIQSGDLAETIRNSLEAGAQENPSLFDFSGTSLGGLTGEDVTGTVNDVAAINRAGGNGADDSPLNNSQMQLLDRLVTEFDQILSDAGSSLLLSNDVRRLGSITTLINRLLQTSGATATPANTSGATSNIEALLGGRSDDNPLVISLR